LRKDLRQGQSYVGAAATAVHRDLRGTGIDWLHRHAYAGGVETSHRFLDGNWSFDAVALGSAVFGSEEALLRTQSSPLRLFQRPDADHVALDPTRTSLFGLGGYYSLAKRGGGRWLYAYGGEARS